MGQSNKEDVTEFPNDVDGDEVLGTEGDNPTDTGNTDEPEKCLIYTCSYQ